MKIIGIIPARYGSTRFPGKPLVNISGKPMIQRVYEQASKVLKTVVVATDDTRIENVVKNFGGKAIITSVDHKSGTDRCAEAIKIINKINNDKFDVIINIQGDEPFIHPEQLKKIIKCFDNKSTQIATLVKQINNFEDLDDINKPKVIINKNNEAIYFSRYPIPFMSRLDKKDWLKKNIFYKHIGLYAYRYDILKKISKLEQSALEIAESLEQLRWIENGYKIKVEFTEHENVSIDTKADLIKLNMSFDE